jgi:hypothetical protein
MQILKGVSFSLFCKHGIERKLSVAKDGTRFIHTVFVIILCPILNCCVDLGISDKHIF